MHRDEMTAIHTMGAYIVHRRIDIHVAAGLVTVGVLCRRSLSRRVELVRETHPLR